MPAGAQRIENDIVKGISGIETIDEALDGIGRGAEYIILADGSGELRFGDGRSLERRRENAP